MDAACRTALADRIPACSPVAGGTHGFEAIAVDDGHPERAALERFIAETYRAAYGARIRHFARHLLGMHEPGGWRAGVGYTFAAESPLFLEHYLDRPAHEAIAARIAVPVNRDQVVEVGNLAAATPGAARRVIVCMTALLHRLGRSWVVFTSTRSLLNSFARLGIEPLVLAQADPARLPGGGRDWGTYYDGRPLVMTANIPLGLLTLASRGAGLRAA